jgi:cell division protein FtsW (lipid II flippase)
LIKDDTASGGAFGALLLLAAILVFGAFGAVMLYSANDGYQVNESTDMGRAAKTNDNMMSIVIENWGILAALVSLLLIGLIAAAFRGGGTSGRF